ncbi:FK506-binding protein 15 [Galleria mellonella]|uniref:FK506-binding protein 15 n=1 Tax=Galleria mellonella TaxID=7137 RepID=A0A6J1X8Q1_GALME|nr:FK506-binding protein 15 [Galleria mellonella]
MLETDEVDEDYFTPAPNTSLANIFGNSHKEQKIENETLKYIPPKPHNLAVKPEETKSTECVFACALLGYEWFNNVYSPRGKIGLAILKVIKSEQHNIILYDSNKTTLSCVTVSPTLEVMVKDNLYLSYYDNQHKYWTIYGKEDEIKKIIDILKNFNTIIKYSSDTEKGPPEPDKIKNIMDTPSKVSNQTEKESDTDSSVNRKTKLSILNRMATVGQSILPPSTLTALKTSDSSDTNDAYNHPKTTRHKLSKNIVRRNNSEKNLIESNSFLEAHRIPLSKTDQSIEKNPLYTHVCGQLVPVTQTSIITSPTNNSNDMNLFISEQRISNSELRINLNRVTDKVDQVFRKITDLEHKDVNSANTSFQNEILQKLLTEYENKIKVYEELIKSKGIENSNTLVKHENTASDNLKQQYEDEINLLKSKLANLEEINLVKTNKISQLEFDIKELEEKIERERLSKNEILQEMEDLRKEVLCKNQELTDINKKQEVLNTQTFDKTSNDVKDKLKNIMNDTFHSISIHFENNDNYTGESIKNIIGAVIKKETLKSLNEL